MLIITRFTGAKSSQIWTLWYDFVIRNVLRRCLKIARVDADVTWGGKLFHTIAPETGNARLLTVVRLTGGTSSRWEAEDYSRCLDVMSARRVKHDCRYIDAVGAVDGSVCHDGQFEGDALLQERVASVGWWARSWRALTDGFRRWVAQQRSEQIGYGGWGIQAVDTEHYCSSPVAMRLEHHVVSAAGRNAAGAIRRNIAKQSVGIGSGRHTDIWTRVLVLRPTCCQEGFFSAACECINAYSSFWSFLF